MSITDEERAARAHGYEQDILSQLTEMQRWPVAERLTILRKIADELSSEVTYWEDEHCLVEMADGSVCGVSLEDGEGFDGKCGSHADEAEARGDYAHHDG